MKKVESKSIVRNYCETILNSKNIYINSILYSDFFFNTNNKLFIQDIIAINYISLNIDFKLLVSSSPENSFTFIHFKENNKLKNCVLVNLQSEGIRGVIVFEKEAIELVSNGLNLFDFNTIYINNNYDFNENKKQNKDKTYSYPLFLFNNKNQHIEFKINFNTIKDTFSTNFTLHPVK